MKEVNFLEERFDRKLFFVLLLKNLIKIIAFTALGAVIFGAIYYVKEDICTPDKYQIESTYNVEYGTDPQTNLEYTYINYASWDTIVKSDVFVNLVKNELAGANFSDEEIKAALSADLKSDLRMPSTFVTMSDSLKAAELNDAVTKAFVNFADEKKEIDKITLFNTSEIVKIEKATRVCQAAVLGGLVFLFIICLTLSFLYFYNEKIYVPDTVMRREKVPCCYLVKGEFSVGNKAIIEDILTNYVKENNNETFYLSAVDGTTDVSGLADKLPKIDGVTYAPKIISNVPMILFAKAGKTSAKAIEREMLIASAIEANVVMVILLDASEKLLRAYYGRE